MMNPRIKSLHFYPLKSAQGLSVQSMELSSTGPKYDREWMLINKNNSFVSQRTHPMLSQVRVKMTDEELVCEVESQSPISIPLTEYGDDVKIEIFGKEASADLLNNKYSEWFSDFLKSDVKLVRSPQNDKRATSGRKGPVTPIQFADGYPLLLANTATLNELSNRLGSEIPMERFRPNIVIENAALDIEDSWRKFTTSGITFLCAKACSRCAVIDVDPATGKKSKEVSKELKSYRMKDNQILFGINLIHESLGTLNVGDELTSFEDL